MAFSDCTNKLLKIDKCEKSPVPVKNGTEELKQMMWAPAPHEESHHSSTEDEILMVMENKCIQSPAIQSLIFYLPW